MVKDVTSRPPVGQNFGNIDQSQTKKKPKEELSLPKLNGLLEFSGLPGLGGPVEKHVTKGDARDTPRQDGPVKNRGEDVKAFFKSVGKEISSFFTKIGEAFSKAFEAIKQAINNRAEARTPVQAQDTAPTPTTVQTLDTAPTPTTVQTLDTATTPTTVKAPQTAPTPTKPVLDKPGVALKEFFEKLGEDLETDYQKYLTTTTDDPKMDRTAYVKDKFPEPPGGRDGIDPTSTHYIGDRIDDARANVASSPKPGVDEMRNIALDRLAEFPTLDIAVESLFKDELKVLQNPLTSATFLRSNSAYTRLDKYLARATVPFDEVSVSLISSKDDQIKANGHLGKLNGIPLAFESLSKDQADGVHGLSDEILGDLLDMSPTKPDSFFNSIPASYRDHLADKAERIMGQTDVPLDQRQDAVKMMYANSLFLRAIVSDLTVTAAKTYGGTTSQSFAVKTMQFVQTFLNGVEDYGKKANELGVEIMNQTKATHQSRFDAFLVAVGMPDLGVTPDGEDQKTVTE